eukprot:jgi/Mesvir1/21229/Mv06665-RA.1
MHFSCKADGTYELPESNYNDWERLSRGADGSEVDGYDDSDDSEPCEGEAIVRGDKTFTFYEGEGESYSSITHWYMSVRQGEQRIAVMEGTLVLRGPGSNFFAACDSVSQELQEVCVTCCGPDGKLRGSLVKQIRNRQRVAEAGRGGFLHIDEVHVVPEMRGRDVTLEMLRVLFDHLDGRWSLAVLAPAPWGPDDRGFRRVDPQVDLKVQKLARMFSRIGFQQVGKSPYFFLESCQVPPANLSKAAVTSTRPFHSELEPARAEPTELELKFIDNLNDMDELIRLKEAGVDPNACHALHYAVANKHDSATILALLQLGARINQPDPQSLTPLHIAAGTSASPETIRLLLSQGADKTAKDSEGRTPFGCFKAAKQSTKDFMVTFGIRPKGKSCEDELMAQLLK